MLIRLFTPGGLRLASICRLCIALLWAATAGQAVAVVSESSSHQAPFSQSADSVQGSDLVSHLYFDASPRLASNKGKPGLSLSEAIAIAKRRHGGEVLSAKRAKDGSGRPIYVIKLLTDGGVVKKVRIAAS